MAGYLSPFAIPVNLRATSHLHCDSEGVPRSLSIVLVLRGRNEPNVFAQRALSTHPLLAIAGKIIKPTPKSYRAVL